MMPGRTSSNRLSRVFIKLTGYIKTMKILFRDNFQYKHADNREYHRNNVLRLQKRKAVTDIRKLVTAT